MYQEKNTNDIANNKEFNIYLLPGMGADERLFDKMEIHGACLHKLRWSFEANCKSLADYAALISERISTQNNILRGSSMGGMVAVEMYKYRKTSGLVLLSAPASREESPLVLKALKTIRAGKWFGKERLYKLQSLADTFMGFRDPKERALFYEMLQSYGPDFLHFAVNAILDWDRKDRPDQYLQIIGEKDQLFKTKRMNQAVTIPDEGHFLTFEQPKTISIHINNYISALTFD